MNLNQILDAVLGNNTQNIRDAEANLKVLAEQDYGSLLLQLGNILCDEAMPVGKRKLCATIIRNSIIANISNISTSKWNYLDQEIKETIKKNVLASLASEINDIRKSGSLAVAGIASVELPQNKWHDIINILVFTSAHENPNYKISSIITIGYIAQEVSCEYLTNEEKCNLLNAILQVLKSEANEEIICNTIDALSALIVHARSNIEYDSNNKLKIFQCLFPHLKNSNIEIIKKVFNCIIEVCRYYHDFLSDNLDDFINISTEFFNNDDENIGILVYEIWSSIAEEEVNRMRNGKQFYRYSDKCQAFLTNAIKYHYLNRNSQKEKQTPDKWNLAKSASVLLGYLSQCCTESIIDFVFLLIKEYINNENSKIKESVLMAYGSIMETIYSDKIKSIIEGSLPTLITMLSDKSLDVRSTDSWIIKKICKFHSEKIISLDKSSPLLLDQFISTLIKNLTSNKKVVSNICESLHFLALANKKYSIENLNNFKTGILSKYYPMLYENLLQIAYANDAITSERNIAVSAFFALGTLTDCAPSDVLNFLNEYFTNFINLLRNTLDKKKIESNEMRSEYQDYLCSTISSYLCDNKLPLTLEQSQFLYNLIKEIFMERGTVFETGILVCSSIALNIGESFLEILPDYGNFLYHGLSLWNVESICRIALVSVSDLIRSLKEKFEPYLEQLLPLVFGIIENIQCDKTLRSRSLMIISDLFVCMKTKALNYIDKIIPILVNAMEASKSTTDCDDPDILEYYCALRENLLECLVCLISNLKGNNKINILNVKIVSEILNYSQKIIEPQYFPSHDILHKSLWIITEFCEIFQSHVKAYICRDKVDYLIKTFKESKNNYQEFEDFLCWAEEIIFSIIYN